jgi:putative flippase GtrA
MTLARPRIVDATWQVLPASLRRRLRSKTGKRFVRFVPVSVAAVVSSQVTLAVLVGVTRLSAGASAVIASMVGAGVSYVLSRWAWERKGRPHVLKETLPFWAVSVGAWTVLGAASHFASLWATSADLGHWQRVGVVNSAYFLANCVTFVTRFAIFHYVLFADRGAKADPASARSARQPGSARVGMIAPDDQEGLTLAGTSAAAHRAGTTGSGAG